LGNEPFVPEWGFPLLGFLVVCLLLLMVLSPIAVVRTQRARAAAAARGIRIEGVRATKSFKLAVPSEILREDSRSIFDVPR
jgi:hypothetical protein